MSNRCAKTQNIGRQPASQYFERLKGNRKDDRSADSAETGVDRLNCRRRDRSLGGEHLGAEDYLQAKPA